MSKNGWGWVPTLYFAEGIPYAVVMTLSVIMYKRLGVSNTDIALYTSWLYLPWVIKPLWSPIVDMLGTRRHWVIAMQWALAAGFGAVALALPLGGWFCLSLAAFWIVAFLSATHDIAADGYYMLALSQERQSFFVGIRTTVYRIAMLTGQGALVTVAGWIELAHPDSPPHTAWMIVMGILSGTFVSVAIWHSITLPHPAADKMAAKITSLSNVLKEFVGTFVSFFKKPHTAIALLFMLLYRFPEAQLVKLITPFLLDTPEAGGLGMTTAQVGICYGTVGVTALMLGGIAGGIVVSKGGLTKWLKPMAWSMSLTCIAFVYLSMAGHVGIPMIYGCVALEQAGYGFGATAYTMYLIFYSQGPNKTSHYAMCTGIMALGMMLPGMIAGKLQELMGYEMFFVWVTACCVLTITVAMLVKVPKDFGRKSN